MSDDTNSLGRICTDAKLLLLAKPSKKERLEKGEAGAETEAAAGVRRQRRGGGGGSKAELASRLSACHRRFPSSARVRDCVYFGSPFEVTVALTSIHESR